MSLVKKMRKTLKQPINIIHVITEKEIRVRDHCQITGKYWGSAQKTCNANYRLTEKIPLMFHNLRSTTAITYCKKLVNFEESRCYIKWSKKMYGFHFRKELSFY